MARIAGRLLSCLTAGAAIASVGACNAVPGTAGRAALPSSYSMGTLNTEVGPEVPILTVAAAAEAALRARGYSIEKADPTDDRAVITGRAPGAGALDRTVVSTWITSTGTAISVHIAPLGDEPTSYAVLDDLLGRLGR